MFNFGLIHVPLFVFVPGPEPPASLLEAGGVGSLMNNVQEIALTTRKHGNAQILMKCIPYCPLYRTAQCTTLSREHFREYQT